MKRTFALGILVVLSSCSAPLDSGPSNTYEDQDLTQAAVSYTAVSMGAGSNSRAGAVNDAGVAAVGIGFDPTPETLPNDTTLTLSTWSQAGGLRNLATTKGVLLKPRYITSGGVIAGMVETEWVEQFEDGFTYYDILQEPFFWSPNRGLERPNLGGSFSNLSEMSESGMAVGVSSLTSGSLRAFAWTKDTGIVNLGTLSGDTGSSARAVNNSGAVVGTSYKSNVSGSRSFYWTSSGGMRQIGTGDVSVDDINDAGVAVGSYQNSGQSRAFSWTVAGGLKDLGTLGGYTNAEAVAADGTTVGVSGGRAFIWTPSGGMKSLGTLGGSSSADRIESGVVTGTLNTSGYRNSFAWTAATGMIELTLGGRSGSTVNGISKGGVVVGQAYDAAGYRYAYAWSAANGMQKLPGETSSDANAVNSSGLIVGRSGSATAWSSGPSLRITSFQLNDVDNKPLTYLSVSPHTYYSRNTNIQGVITVEGAPDDTLTSLELEVLQSGAVKSKAVLANGVTSTLLTSFGSDGKVSVTSSQLLFKLASAGLGTAINQTSNGQLSLRIKAKSQKGGEVVSSLISVTKLVRYTKSNRYPPRDPGNCIDVTPSYPCGGDDWVKPSVKTMLESVSGITVGDLSNMNGGIFPPHQTHKTGNSADLKFAGYEMRLGKRTATSDIAIANKLIGYLNHPTYGSKITRVYVTFEKKDSDPFWKAIANVRLKRGVMASSVIVIARGHDTHFHWEITD